LRRPETLIFCGFSKAAAEGLSAALNVWFGKESGLAGSGRNRRKLTYPAVGPSHPNSDAAKSANDTAIIAPASKRVLLLTYMRVPSMLTALVTFCRDVRNRAAVAYLLMSKIGRSGTAGMGRKAAAHSADGCQNFFVRSQGFALSYPLTTKENAK
jgi:hypothetical protein